MNVVKIHADLNTTNNLTNESQLMSDETKRRVDYWVDVIFKVGTPIGLALLFFLKASFVTATAFNVSMANVDQRLIKIETALQVMAEKNRIDFRQDAELNDHENRLRVVEHK